MESEDRDPCRSVRNFPAYSIDPNGDFLDKLVSASPSEAAPAGEVYKMVALDLARLECVEGFGSERDVVKGPVVMDEEVYRAVRASVSPAGVAAAPRCKEGDEAKGDCSM